MQSKEFTTAIEKIGFKVCHTRRLRDGRVRAYLFVYYDPITKGEYDPDTSKGPKVSFVEWNPDRPNLFALYAVEWKNKYSVAQQDVFVGELILPNKENK